MGLAERDLPGVRPRRDPLAVVRFALGEGDVRLAELIARALRREQWSRNGTRVASRRHRRKPDR
jgi:hypothetical protein